MNNDTICVIPHHISFAGAQLSRRWDRGCGYDWCKGLYMVCKVKRCSYLQYVSMKIICLLMLVQPTEQWNIILWLWYSII